MWVEIKSMLDASSILLHTSKRISHAFEKMFIQNLKIPSAVHGGPRFLLLFRFYLLTNILIESLWHGISVGSCNDESIDFAFPILT